MRSRFFGASSYDDDDDSSYNDEEEPMDMSGFIGSTTVEQPPVIERRRREPRPEPTASAVTPTSPDMSGIGNMGPRSVPPPTSNMGYTPAMVSAAADNTGSPWNPLWAHDESFGAPWLPVVSKTSGLAAIGGAALVARGIDWGTKTKTLAVVGGALYLHPALGLKHGAVESLTRDWWALARGGAVALSHGVPLLILRGIYTHGLLSRGK